MSRILWFVAKIYTCSMLNCFPLVLIIAVLVGMRHRLSFQVLSKIVQLLIKTIR